MGLLIVCGSSWMEGLSPSLANVRAALCTLPTWKSPQGSSQHGSWLHQNEQGRRWRRGSKYEPVGSHSLIFYSYIKWHLSLLLHFTSEGSVGGLPHSRGGDYAQCEHEEDDHWEPLSKLPPTLIHLCTLMPGLGNVLGTLILDLLIFIPPFKAGKETES
jgi:hypothetical protein